jgi:hypothetical protein
MTRTSDTYTGAFVIERRTDNAIKLTDIESGLVDWVPLSQVEEIHDQPDGTVLVTMQKWIARKKGFCDE